MHSFCFVSLSEKSFCLMNNVSNVYFLCCPSGKMCSYPWSLRCLVFLAKMWVDSHTILLYKYSVYILHLGWLEPWINEHEFNYILESWLSLLNSKHREIISRLTSKCHMPLKFKHFSSPPWQLAREGISMLMQMSSGLHHEVLPCAHFLGVWRLDVFQYSTVWCYSLGLVNWIVCDRSSSLISHWMIYMMKIIQTWSKAWQL